MPPLADRSNRLTRSLQYLRGTVGETRVDFQSRPTKNREVLGGKSVVVAVKMTVGGCMRYYDDFCGICLISKIGFSAVRCGKVRIGIEKSEGFFPTSHQCFTDLQQQLELICEKCTGAS